MDISPDFNFHCRCLQISWLFKMKYLGWRICEHVMIYTETCIPLRLKRLRLTVKRVQHTNTFYKAYNFTPLRLFFSFLSHPCVYSRSQEEGEPSASHYTYGKYVRINSQLFMCGKCLVFTHGSRPVSNRWARLRLWGSSKNTIQCRNTPKKCVFSLTLCNIFSWNSQRDNMATKARKIKLHFNVRSASRACERKLHKKRKLYMEDVMSKGSI